MNLSADIRPRRSRFTRKTASWLFTVLLLGLGAFRLHRYLDEKSHPFGAHFCAQEMKAHATALFASLQLNGVAIGTPRLFHKPAVNHNILKHWALTWHMECEAEGRHVIMVVDDATGQLRFLASSFHRDPSVAASIPRAAIATPREAAEVATHTVRSLSLLPNDAAYRFTEIPTLACRQSVWLVNMEVRDARKACHEVRMLIDRKTGFPLMVRAVPAVSAPLS